MPDDNVLQFYKKRFDFHPDKATPEQAAVFDKAVAAIESAQANPYIISNGKWTENPALVALRETGIPKKYAQALSLWKNYKHGILPESTDVERLTKGGVPRDKVEAVAKERDDDFVGRAASSYAMWERDEEQAATKKGKPVAGEQGAPQQAQPAPTPQPIQPALPDQPLPQPQQAPTFQPSINNGQGQFVPAQFVQEPTKVASL